MQRVGGQSGNSTAACSIYVENRIEGKTGNNPSQGLRPRKLRRRNHNNHWLFFLSEHLSIFPVFMLCCIFFYFPNVAGIYERSAFCPAADGILCPGGGAVAALWPRDCVSAQRRQSTRHVFYWWVPHARELVLARRMEVQRQRTLTKNAF